MVGGTLAKFVPVQPAVNESLNRSDRGTYLSTDGPTLNGTLILKSSKADSFNREITGKSVLSTTY